MGVSTYKNLRADQQPSYQGKKREVGRRVEKGVEGCEEVDHEGRRGRGKVDRGPPLAANREASSEQQRGSEERLGKSRRVGRQISPLAGVWTE